MDYYTNQSSNSLRSKKNEVLELKNKLEVKEEADNLYTTKETLINNIS